MNADEFDRIMRGAMQVPPERKTKPERAEEPHATPPAPPASPAPTKRAK